MPLFFFFLEFSLLTLLLCQAIAAMMRAQEVDPRNLEVLLALGVSHTNGNYCILFCFSLFKLPTLLLLVFFVGANVKVLPF